MLKIFFLILAFFLTQNLMIIDAKAAEEKLEEKMVPANVKIQSDAELTEDLKAQKAAAEPFNPKDVKIDVHSLGLDDVDDKKNITKKVVVDEKIKEENLPVKTVDTKPEKSLAKVDEASVNKKDDVKIITKIQNFVNENIINKVAPAQPGPKVEAPLTSNVDIKKPSAKYLKSQKKYELKKRIEKEKRQAELAQQKAKQEEKMIKLHKLREEYLIKPEVEAENKSAEEIADEDFIDDEKEILPREKNLSWSNRFLSYEIAPAPILDRYRGNDNKHIPIIPTVREKIDMLFQIITARKNGDPAAFNSAYQYVLNPNVYNAQGDNLLTYATLLQRYAVMASILGKGADPDLANVLGHTPIDIAIELLDLKAVTMLLEMNADPFYVDGLGRTYLMHATRVGFLPLVDLFVRQGLDVNAMDDDGITALAIANRHRKEIIAQYLLKHGAKTWIKKPYVAKKQNLIKELNGRWKSNGPGVPINK